MKEKTLICARESCDRPLNTGTKYCSRECANLARSENKQKEVAQAALEQVKIVRRGDVPKAFEDWALGTFGHSGAALMLGEMRRQIQAGDGAQLSVRPVSSDYGAYPYYPVGSTAKVPALSEKPPEQPGVEPYTPLEIRAGGGYLSNAPRENAISPDDIDRMLSLGPCVLALRLKQGPILGALASRRKWSLRCKDKKLKSIVEMDLHRFFLRHGSDMLMSMAYGSAFGNMIWVRKTADEVGDIKGVGGGSKWWVLDKVEWAHPNTVTDIIRKQGTNEFAGFGHRREHMKPNDVIIAPPAALVITHDEKFGDMWGRSILDPGYDFAVWYERVMISFLRFLDRDAAPVVVCYGPSLGTSYVDGLGEVNNPKYGLMIAEYARDHTALFVPSDRDMVTKEPLWRVEYLSAEQVGAQFVGALQYLSTEITRSAVVGDRSATQSSEYGSYSAGEIHDKVTQVDNDALFRSLLFQLNDYVVLRYSQFNTNYNNPTAVELSAQVLDPVEREILMKLFATSGNTKIGDGTPMDIIDFERAYRDLQIPVLSEEEQEAQRQKRMKEKKENMKLAQQVGPPKSPFQSQQSQSQQRPPAQQQPAQQQQTQQPTKNQQARASIADMLSKGQQVPVLLTMSQAAIASQLPTVIMEEA